MKKYFGLFILIFLTFSFFSCEKKSLNEKLQEEVNSKKNNLSKIERLIQKGADVNYENMIEYIIWSSSISNDVLNLFIQNGVDLNYCVTKEDNKYEFENYHLADCNKKYLVNYCDSLDKLQTLIDNGAPLEIDCGNGITPLIMEIEMRKHVYNNSLEQELKIIETMIKNGADVNHVSDNGITPLLTALEYNYRAVVDLLIKYGAKIRTENVKITVGVTPGNPYAEHLTDTFVTVNHSEVNLLALCGYADILQEFLETSGYNPNKRDPDGLDLFCHAVIGNNYETVKMLMKYCKTINKKQYNIKDRDGNNHYYTLYGIADYSDCDESKRALVECGSDRSK